MIRSIIQSSLRFRPVVVALAVVLMGFGITRLDQMPVDVFPEILPVTVTVQTEALGLSAAEVEQLITVPIEADLLTGTPWVEVMRSESIPGVSSIELTFKPGTSPMHARQVVQERLTQAHALPNVSKPPQMIQPQSSTNRIMLVGLSSKTQSLIEMSVLARWTIRPRLMGVPGVANVAIWGQRERQLQVQVDPERLRASKVSLLDIVKTAGNSLWYSPLSYLESSVAGTGGFIETPNQRVGVRHVLPITVAADLAKVPVEESTMRLGDVATVVEDHQPLIGDAMSGQGPGLLLVIEKLPGVNTLGVTREIHKALESLKPGLGGIEFDTSLYRPAGYIYRAIANVARAMLIALILVAAALFALSYSWRAALVGLVAIPTSLMAAVMALHATGATINAMVLAGLVIALGAIIDDAIIDTHRFLRRLGKTPDEPASQTLLQAWSGTRSSLMYATVIVLLSVVPLTFMTGAAGEFVKPMALAYGIAVLASLLVAVVVTPALALLLLDKTPLERPESAFAGWLRRWYDRMVPQPVVFAFGIVATLAVLAVLPRLQVPLAPTFKESDLLVRLDAVPGTGGAEMNRIIDRVNRELRTIPGVRDVGGHVGRASLSDQIVGMNSSELWVSLDPKANYEATVAAVEEVMGGYPGIKCDVSTYLKARFGKTLSPLQRQIVVRLYGQGQDVLESEAEKLRLSIAGINGVVDPRVEFETREPVVEVKVDLDAARAHGIKPGDVRRAAATLLAGIIVGNLFEEQKVFEVVVWGVPKVRHSVAEMKNLLIETPEGGSVRLGDVASVRVGPAPNVIRRENVARCLDLVANVNGRSLEAVTADVRGRIRETALPLEYRAELLGDFADQRAARLRVVGAAIACAIGILFILQAAFGSWSLAFAVLLTLPMALAGSAIAAAATGATLSLGSLAGILTVFAIAVRHGIMLINRYRELRQEQGLSFGPELVLQGTRESAVPILLAVIVIAMAVIPFMVLGDRPGLEILGPMAVVILGGLVTATLYTLWIVPALYSRFGARAMPDAVSIESL